MSKPTIATVKAFIRKNRAQLLVKCNSSFDAMVDGCTTNHGAAFTPAGDTHIAHENTLGIKGVWIVGRSRDYVREFSRDGFTGFLVYNACGEFEIAIRDTPLKWTPETARAQRGGTVGT